MSVTHVVGVDPGLVNTGVVRLVFAPEDHELFVDYEVVLGPDAVKTQHWILNGGKNAAQLLKRPTVFIEGYRPRAHFGTDIRMVEAVQRMKTATGGTALDNMGVKKVIKQALMEKLNLWKFHQVSNHQDLRSAARIALFGMVKDPALNKLLSDVVRGSFHGDSWMIRHVV